MRCWGGKAAEEQEKKKTEKKGSSEKDGDKNRGSRRKKKYVSVSFLWQCAERARSFGPRLEFNIMYTGVRARTGACVRPDAIQMCGYSGL